MRSIGRQVTTRCIKSTRTKPEDKVRHELLILRHAKSDWGAGMSDDFSRPLATRGRKDVVKMGNKMHSHGWKPDAVLCSPALRAKMTCETVCNIAGFPLNKIQWNDDIYAASLATLLNVLKTVDDSIGVVMLVGHNPGLEQLLTFLCPDAPVKPNGKLLTTCNIARIGLNSRWNDLNQQSSTLLDLLRPVGAIPCGCP